jgi:hypothetical protein
MASFLMPGIVADASQNAMRENPQRPDVHPRPSREEQLVPCPHYTHTDRTVGVVTTHVCRDCTARLPECPGHDLVEAVDELEGAEIIDEELEPTTVDAVTADAVDQAVAEDAADSAEAVAADPEQDPEA